VQESPADATTKSEKTKICLFRERVGLDSPDFRTRGRLRFRGETKFLAENESVTLETSAAFAFSPSEKRRVLLESVSKIDESQTLDSRKPRSAKAEKAARSRVGRHLQHTARPTWLSEPWRP
jgi:hypothetical protein